MHATTQLAKEVSSENVTITSICPGVVKTDISREQTSLVMRCAISTFGALMMNPPEVGANPILSGTIQGQQSHGRFWKSDKIQDVGLSLAGDANQKLGLRIWGEMADALTKEVPGFPSALEAIKDKNSR
jgi:NAD(P)-dependent dehydrogenase (short-subunit alcohol dehydrogenase family)